MLGYLANLFRTSSVSSLAIGAFLIRLVVIGVGMLQDRLLPVPYTDVDYLVVTDGARHMLAGGSPFQRETYRYTPLLALVFTPNAVLFEWGKVVLSLADVVAGYFVLKVLGGANDASSKLLVCALVWFNPVVINVSTRGNSDILIAALTLASLSSCTWVLTKQTALPLSCTTYALSLAVLVG